MALALTQLTINCYRRPTNHVNVKIKVCTRDMALLIEDVARDQQQIAISENENLLCRADRLPNYCDV